MIQKILKWIKNNNTKMKTKLERDKGCNKMKYLNLHGNPIKFKKVESIFYDLSWKKELNLFQRFTSTAILFPFNKMWVLENR